MPFSLELSPHTWFGTLIAVFIAVVAAVCLIVIVRLFVNIAGKRSPWLPELLNRMRHRWRLFLLVIAVWIACAITLPSSQDWWPAISHVFLIVLILNGAWLLSAATSFGIQRLIARYGDPSVSFNTEARRKRTQLTILSRLITVIIAVLAIGTVLFSFPQVRAIGVSVLASAGLLSVIAGLAAQSTLANLFAGLQLAFSNAIKVDDVVVVEGEWGRIGEITLSYVVVYVWDERRLMLPCTYFTTQPFENWTRQSARILGTVYMDLDWRVPIQKVREKYDEILAGSELWDGRVSSVLVTDAVGGYVTVRFLLSAADSDAQWSLRCHVREEIMTWLQEEHPEALPVSRVSLEAPRTGSLTGSLTEARTDTRTDETATE